MKAHGKKHRLLIVDDATYLLFSFKRLLADMADEWEILLMDDPVAALAAVRENPVDLVISDYQMPAMLGTDLVRKIKAVTPGTVCIIMTGSERDTNQLLAMEEVSGVLEKPCAFADLRRTITAVGAADDREAQSRRIVG
jgi:two-component system probable response regulator PhcQ